tara:strand:- start:34786 stop:35409 length:624 start_codon:yes stop_codon:yes gene_type:complete
MLKNPQTEEQMIEDEGAEFKVGVIYYKFINGRLHCARKEDEEWTIAYHSRSYYEDMTGFVDLRTEAKSEDNSSMKNELYASLELQITMAQDYSEWLKQETKRNDELLNAHSAALRRLNDLMVQSPSEEENVDSGKGEELPCGLKWEDAPEWAMFLAKDKDEGGRELIWCDSQSYEYVDFSNKFTFHSTSRFDGLSSVDVIATRPEEV